MVRLFCPLCGALACEAPELTAGTCAGCGAAFAGGGDDPPAGAALAMEAWGVSGRDPRVVADGLFRLPVDDPLNRVLGVMSDRREGFYRWWFFVAPGQDPAALMDRAAGHSAT
ncbi:MAG: hypothetical protein U0Y82_03045 [Thermoleophilia bacterium]